MFEAGGIIFPIRRCENLMQKYAYIFEGFPISKSVEIHIHQYNPYISAVIRIKLL